MSARVRPIATFLLATSLLFAALCALGSWFVPIAGAATKPAAAASPADTLPLTLDEAVRWALEHGPDARIAGEAIRAANGRVREAMAAAMPQVNANLVYSRKFDSIFQGVTPDTGVAGEIASLFKNTSFAAVHSWTAELTASQLLWSGGRVGAALSAAKAYRKSANADLEEARARVRLETERAYLEALYTRDVLAIAEASLAQARAQLKQVQLYQREGSRSEYDLLRAQVDAANQEPPVVAARNARDLAMLELKRQLLVPLERPVALRSPLAFADSLVPVVDDASTGAAHRASLARADAQVEGYKQLLRIERAARWPQISLSGTVSHQAFPATERPELDEFRRDASASVKLEWPIFQGTRTFGAVQRATAELRQAEIGREQTQDGVEVEIARARDEVRRTLATLVARRGTAGWAARAYHLATVRFSNGLATQLEVTDARLQLQNAQVNEIGAVKDYRLALAELARATGVTPVTRAVPIDQLSAAIPAEEASR